MNSINNPCFGTPKISVVNNQGSVIREINYYRCVADEPLEERIERKVYNSLNQLISCQDSRFFAEKNEKNNFRYMHSLSEKSLRTQSLDAGESCALYDPEGRIFWIKDARGTEQFYDYDALGRFVTRREKIVGEQPKIRERIVYGESVLEAVDFNLRGQIASHYDTAGCVDYRRIGYTVTGSQLSQTRSLLPAEVQSHWDGASEQEWSSALEDVSYHTYWQFDLNGHCLQEINASGHSQESYYDIAGRLKRQLVKSPADKTGKVVISALTYTASGNPLQEILASNIVTDYSYEPETQRLLSIKTTRTPSSVPEVPKILKWLEYKYDSVGNVIYANDKTENVSFFKGQKVTSEKRYEYDTLYQLIKATGRENAVLVDYSKFPQKALGLDKNNYVSYARHFEYDKSGNISVINHQAADGRSFTHRMTISSDSNRAFQESVSACQANFTSYFDPCGNQTCLDGGQSLAWNGLNQLKELINVKRSATESDEQPEPDRESYSYGYDGHRVRKTSFQRLENTIRIQEVIYLPGLELRRTRVGNKILEDFEVICFEQPFGHNQIRLLNWHEGKPEDIPNQQLRFSLSDRLGSTHAELDEAGRLLTAEEFYPYGGTAVWLGKNQSEVKYKIVRYSGKERDASGLYYYGLRYYQPWLGRWLSTDPAGTEDGLNLFRMVQNNPITLVDQAGTFGERLWEFVGRLVSPVTAWLGKKLRKAGFTFFLSRQRDQGVDGIINAANANRKLFFGIGLVVGIGLTAGSIALFGVGGVLGSIALGVGLMLTVATAFNLFAPDTMKVAFYNGVQKVYNKLYNHFPGVANFLFSRIFSRMMGGRGAESEAIALAVFNRANGFAAGVIGAEASGLTMGGTVSRAGQDAAGMSGYIAGAMMPHDSDATEMLSIGRSIGAGVARTDHALAKLEKFLGLRSGRGALGLTIANWVFSRFVSGPARTLLTGLTRVAGFSRDIQARLMHRPSALREAADYVAGGIIALGSIMAGSDGSRQVAEHVVAIGDRVEEAVAIGEHFCGGRTLPAAAVEAITQAEPQNFELSLSAGMVASHLLSTALGVSAPVALGSAVVAAGVAFAAHSWERGSDSATSAGTALSSNGTSDSISGLREFSRVAAVGAIALAGAGIAAFVGAGAVFSAGVGFVTQALLWRFFSRRENNQD